MVSARLYVTTGSSRFSNANACAGFLRCDLIERATFVARPVGPRNPCPMLDGRDIEHRVVETAGCATQFAHVTTVPVDLDAPLSACRLLTHPAWLKAEIAVRRSLA